MNYELFECTRATVKLNQLPASWSVDFTDSHSHCFSLSLSLSFYFHVCSHGREEGEAKAKRGDWERERETREVTRKADPLHCPLTHCVILVTAKRETVTKREKRRERQVHGQIINNDTGSQNKITTERREKRRGEERKEINCTPH